MSEDYAKVDSYLNGYRTSLRDAFEPETGWFWFLLSKVHGEVCDALVIADRAGVDELHDELVDAINRELGQ